MSCVILGTYTKSYWLFTWNSNLIMHPVFYLATLIINRDAPEIYTWMKEWMGLMHNQMQTFYWKVHTVRSGFKVIGLLENFQFSMWFSVFQLAMSRKVFKDRSLKNHWVSSLSTSLCLPPPNPYPDLILRAALGDLYYLYSILLWRKWVLEWLSNYSSSYNQQMLKKKKSNAISISQTLKQIDQVLYHVPGTDRNKMWFVVRLCERFEAVYVYAEERVPIS